jgi:hypothetical protein
LNRLRGGPTSRGTRAHRFGAASLLAAVLCAAPLFAAPSEPTEAVRSAAQKVYQEGAEHYKAGRFLEALSSFKTSYEMVPSPNSHLMIARTLRDRGELTEAYVEYGKLVPEAEAAAERDAKYAKTAESARSEREKLRALIGLVKLHIKNPPDDLHIVVAAHPIERADWAGPIAVLPGPFVVRASSQGAPAQTRELNVAAGNEVDVELDFGPAANAAVVPAAHAEPVPDIPRQPETHKVNRMPAYIALGVGGAGLLTFIIFGALNESTFHSLEQDCLGGHCPPDKADEIDRGRTQQTIANVGIGVALAGGAAAAVLFATAAQREHRDNAGLRIAPRVTSFAIGADGAAVRGEF